MKKQSSKLKIIFSSLLIINLILIQFSTGVNAYTSAIQINPNNVQYQKWESLPKEEKSNTIQPSQHSINLNDSIKRSTLNMLKANANSEDLPEKYILTDEIPITVKNQQETYQCWAFSAINLLETNNAKLNSGRYKVLSPRHLEYITSKTFLDGTNKKAYNRELGNGGNYLMALGAITAGYAPVTEKDMPFENNQNKINLSDIEGKKVVQKVEQYTELPSIAKEYDSGSIVYTNAIIGEDKKVYTEDEVKVIRNSIKKHIMKYGAVGAYTYGGEDSLQFFSTDLNSYYCNTNSYVTDHSVTIVGWDDNYSVDNFNTNNKPKNNGAYIVLDSYGENVFQKGYRYISYDDAIIETALVSVMKTTDIDYDNIYQYDELGANVGIAVNMTDGSEAKEVYVANVFNKNEIQGNKKEYLNEVAIQVGSTSNIEIYANLENADKSKIEKIASPGILETGYHTIELPTPLEISGDKFVVAVRYINQEGVTIPLELNYKSNNKGSNAWDTATAEVGQTYLASKITDPWIDLVKDMQLKDANGCVKAFTVYEEVTDTSIPVKSISLNKTSIEMTEGERTNLIVSFNPTNATNKNVKWYTDDLNIVSVDTNGNIKAIKEGKTTVRVISEDGEKTASCEVIVNKKNTNDDDIYEEPDKDPDPIVPDPGDGNNGQNDNNNNDNGNVNNPNNNSSNNVSNKINNNVVGGKNVSNDTTVANKILPYAGNSIVIIVGVIAVLGFGIYAFIRVKEYKDIK